MKVWLPVKCLWKLETCKGKLVRWRTKQVHCGRRGKVGVDGGPAQCRWFLDCWKSGGLLEALTSEVWKVICTEVVIKV